MPEGRSASLNTFPSMTSVCPALWPPWKRTTTSAPSESQSTILPFPSSPHWAPTTTTLAIPAAVLCPSNAQNPGDSDNERSRGGFAELGVDDRPVGVKLRRGRGRRQEKRERAVLDWPHAMSICPARPSRSVSESDMTPEERQMLASLFERINATSASPREPQAEAFINDAVRAMPFAPYVLAQTVLVQQHALEAAAQRVAELEAATRQGGEQQPEQTSFLGNLGRSIFGGGAPSAPPRPDAPAYQRGPWGAPPAQSGGGGFLQNAASTAAGVAGGVALGNLLGGLFGGHSGGGIFGSGFGGAGLPGGGSETINNFYERAPGNAFDPGQIEPSAPDDAGYLDDSSFDDSSGGGSDDV